jgi:hypothetical protein
MKFKLRRFKSKNLYFTPLVQKAGVIVLKAFVKKISCCAGFGWRRKVALAPIPLF